MNVPGAPSVLFLGYLLLILPYLAIKSARRIRGPAGAPAGALPISRTLIWANSLIASALLLVFAWWVGRGFGYDVFAVPELRARDLAAAGLALIVLLAIRKVLRAFRTEEERKRLLVYKMAPRTPVEWTLWIATVLSASVGEEAAYRGTGVQILWYSLGNPWIAVLLCSLAFAAAHWVQGGKSAAAIFAIALTMHGLVAVTDTLVLAMVVHALYDFIAGWLIHRQARADERQSGAAAASG